MVPAWPAPPHAEATALKQRLWAEIDRRRDELIRLCADSLRAPGENPPGDTRAPADYYEAILRRTGLPVERFEPRPGIVNLVCSLPGRAERPRFVFNAHLDHFPADDPALWSFPPYGGEAREGRILGRGAADMRGGLTASLFSFLLLHEFRVPLQGPLTLMLVSDEESGSRWGTGWVLGNRPDLAGDACMVGEPEGPSGLRVGEKGKAQFRLIAEGPAFAGNIGIGDDPIIRIGAALQEVRKLVELPDNPPPEMLPVLSSRMSYPRSDRERGREWLARRLSVTAGVIRGGIKVNVAPRRCEVEVDCRLPFGITPEEVRIEVGRRLAVAGLGGIRFESMPPVFSATHTDPNHPLVRLARTNATEVTGEEPLLTIAYGGTDCRWFRPRGVPAIVFGPRPYNVAAPDEYITVDDLVTVTKVHLATALEAMFEPRG